jgi:hydroxyethylthiazole kinase
VEPATAAVPLDRALKLVRARRPRIHAVLNAVAQPFTANALAAIGAEPSMSVHPREIRAMAASADAVLVNLGMLDPVREEALSILAEDAATFPRPLVLDPVMVDRSPFRLELARRFLAAPHLIIKGNVAEMAVLAGEIPVSAIRVTTGPEDRVEGEGVHRSISGGHPWLPRLSGSGCFAGALIATFAAVLPDRVEAADAALTLLRAAATEAGALAAGPGSFAMHLVDRLAARADAVEARA